MFTVRNVIRLKDGKSMVEATCLSTDAKPTIYDNGSMLMEIDTATMYLFDGENGEWIAWQ